MGEPPNYHVPPTPPRNDIGTWVAVVIFSIGLLCSGCWGLSSLLMMLF